VTAHLGDPATPAASFAHRRVLFVDDDPSILDGLRRLLRSERDRWEAVFAHGGELAMAELEHCVWLTWTAPHC
jgi:hypothetical protein